MNKKLLFYGGAFNPPHLGHERLFESALAAINPDLALIIPTGVSPHKRSASTPFRLRMAMCRCFKKLGENVRVSSIEYTGKNTKHKSYTYSTLRKLKKKFPDYDIYMLIGSDMLSSFRSWHLYRRIMAECTIVAGCREGDKEALESFRKHAGELEREGGSFVLLNFNPIKVSSTELREALAQGDDKLCEMLSPEVKEIIDKRGLYKK